jgi:hypothetical protein
MTYQIRHVRRRRRRRWLSLGLLGDDGGEGKRMCTSVAKEQLEAATKLDFEIDRHCRAPVMVVGSKQVTHGTRAMSVVRTKTSRRAYGVAGYHIRLALALTCGGSPVRVRICPLFLTLLWRVLGVL